MIATEHRHCQKNARVFKTRVESVNTLTDDLFILYLSGFPNDFDPEPGMFLHLKVAPDEHPLLRRPFSIQSYNDGTAAILIREVGAGSRILHHLQPGDEVDTLGPLGTTFPKIGKDDSVLMVGGGVGVAPLIACCHEADAGARVDFCFGVRSENEVQGVEPFMGERGPVHIHLSSDDGSVGYQGFCTDIASRLLEERSYTKIFTCGPWVMMAKTARLAIQKEIPFFASLEVQMGCGLGACLACVYESTEGDFIRSCIDGPVVDGHNVVWERV
ncbi:MAG: dihydroorotate dehydrogenase electron transfer subunit [Candidatus Omnitrophica bacterium]|nr:dihydroorotate dehydrogenase electron transfer subunit [Candidatus Omnitrophota bacterium]MCB9781774.1 dihydroorotate dehydrogenase electron transfer subunit [Candidatus Omnitrophota bacterium]